MSISRALGLLVAVAADQLFGDPKKHHPVAWFGSWAQRVEKRTYADSVPAGAVHVVASLAPAVAAAVVVERATRRHPALHVAATAAAGWAVLGAASLAKEGEAISERLAAEDLTGARSRIPNLCSRDPEGLDEEGVARAATESMAENTADAAVASLLWGAALGIPGLVAHRGLNTLDAMIGYRTPRYLNFGKVAAKLDDAAAWLPSRITGAVACLLAPAVGGETTEAWRVMRRDARSHPSPNGGWCEAAWAGALGIRLGGRNVYFGREEVRASMGDGESPGPAELSRAARLVTLVTACVAAATAAVVTTIGRTRS